MSNNTRLDAINKITDTTGGLTAIGIAQNHVGHVVSQRHLKAIAVPEFSTVKERQQQLTSDIPDWLKSNWLIVVGKTKNDSHKVITAAIAARFIQNERHQPREYTATGFKFPTLDAK